MGQKKRGKNFVTSKIDYYYILTITEGRPLNSLFEDDLLILNSQFSHSKNCGSSDFTSHQKVYTIFTQIEATDINYSRHS